MGGEFTSQADTDSLGMTLNGTDVGSINGPALDPVMAGGAGGAKQAGLRRSAVVQRRRRLAKLYTHLLHHVIQPELRTMISDHCDAVALFNGQRLRRLPEAQAPLPSRAQRHDRDGVHQAVQRCEVLRCRHVC